MSQSYTIRSGDNLGAIARRFNTTVDRIAQANHIANPNQIYAGQKLTIPDGFDAPKATSSGGGGSRSYTVQSGDSLSAIASKFGTTVGAIASANGISNPNRINVGQRLTIPGGGGTQGTSAPSAPSGASRSYTVQSGDTLSGIAGRFGTTVGAIASANGIRDPNRISVGQRLNIPGSGGTQAPSAPAPSGGSRSYTVQSGDTLSGIAGRFGTTVGAIASANGISDPNRINVGQRLTIPGGGGSTQGPSAPTPAPSGGGSRSYTVQPGDTLSGIASRYHTTVGAIASANGISNPNVINVGQRLTIPGGDGFDPGPVSGPGPVTGPVPGNTSGGVSLQQLRAIMPTLPQAKAEQYLPYLNAAMNEAHINTPRRQAAFLAQLAHESVQLRYFEEIASGAAYEGRRDLGNIYPGDGVRYKGRGPIQLTGRNNYRAAGQALGIDLENNPRRAADADVGFRTAAWFWTSRNLNSYADAGNFDAITLRVNGGYNGKASRDAYYATALRVLGG